MCFVNSVLLIQECDRGQTILFLSKGEGVKVDSHMSQSRKVMTRACDVTYNKEL